MHPFTAVQLASDVPPAQLRSLHTGPPLPSPPAVSALPTPLPAEISSSLQIQLIHLEPSDYSTLLYSFLLHQLCVRAAESRPTLCDPMDCSPPASSIYRILQARILEWVAISFSRGSSQARDQTCVSCISCIGRQILYH